MSLDNAPQIVYRDESVVAVAKPSGWLAHPSPMAPQADSLLGWTRAKVGAWVYPAHRLDRPTSGVMLFGLSPEAAAALGAGFASGVIRKYYIAIVRGTLRGEGLVDKPVCDEDGSEKQAQTAYKALAHCEAPWPVRPHPSARYTLVALAPRTGRRHQLRQHLRSLSHPIIGDTRYGDGAHNRAAAAQAGMNRLMLHATALQFPGLGESGELIDVEALPSDAAFAGAFRLFEELPHDLTAP